MKKTKAKLIKTMLGSLLLSIVFLPSIASAAEATWGPERPTYIMDDPAGEPAFNSITDNPTIDDERKFIRIAHIPTACEDSAIDTMNYDTASVDKHTGDATVSNGSCILEFKQSVDIEPNEQYMVFIYYHNNAESGLNATGAGLASDVRLFSSYPELISGTRGEVEAKITYKNFLEDDGSSNVPTKNVWAKAYFNNNTNKEIALRYVSASATNYNVGYKDTDGKIKPSDTAALKQRDQFIAKVVLPAESDGNYDLFDSAKGAKLGFGDWQDGEDYLGTGSGFVFGCEPYHGVVTYVLQSYEMSGTIEKEVSKDGGKTYGETVEALPGDTLRYRVTIKNTGTANLTGAVFFDSLPKGLTVVPGSYKLSTDNSGTWDTLEDREKFLLNTIASGRTVQIIYDVKVSEDLEADCDGVELTNTATLIYDSVTLAGTTKTDTAEVVVKKSGEECAPKEFNATVKKEVSVDEGKKFSNEATILPGATVRYKVTIKNTGTSDIEKVNFVDKLPKGLTLVAGSVKMNVEGQEKWSELQDTLAYSFNNLVAGQTIYVVYDATAGEDFDCKGSELENKAEISYVEAGNKEGTFKESKIKITVKKSGEECTPKELPETGPMEMTVLAVIVLGIAGGTVYLILAKRELKRLTADATAEKAVDDGVADNMVNDDKNDGGALNA